eukprot:4598376-Amphidinium_carterae.3
MPQPQGFLTPEGSITWADADYYVVIASHRNVMQQVVSSRPEFAGIEFGIDGRTVKAMRTLANRNDHASRAVLNAACGGLWMEGSASYTLYDCPVLESQRKQAAVPAPREDIPKCVRVLGLGTLFPCPLPCPEEAPSGTTTDEVLFTDGSGKHPTEPNHRRCGCGVSGETTKLSYPLPGCWESVYRAELHASMVACERMQGSGMIVTDCKGAAVVANKLKHGLRVPRGRHSRIETRIRDSIGQIE